MPQRSQPAQIAIPGHIHSQQHHRHRTCTVILPTWRIVQPLAPGSVLLSGGLRAFRRRQSKDLSSSPATRHPPLATDLHHHSHNRLYFRRPRRLIKWHRRIHPSAVRQCHGSHLPLHRSRNNLSRSIHSPQKRIMTMTMQMHEHEATWGTKVWVGEERGTTAIFGNETDDGIEYEVCSRRSLDRLLFVCDFSSCQTDHCAEKM